VAATHVGLVLDSSHVADEVVVGIGVVGSGVIGIISDCLLSSVVVVVGWLFESVESFLSSLVECFAIET